MPCGDELCPLPGDSGGTYKPWEKKEWKMETHGLARHGMEQGMECNMAGNNPASIGDTGETYKLWNGK